MATTQTAAEESVDDVLGTMTNRVGVRPSTDSHPVQSTPQGSEHRQFPPFDAGFYNGKSNYIERHERQLSNRSNGSGGMMPPPPPLRHPNGHRTNGFGGGK